MRSYIVMVASAAVLAAFCDILIPKGWQKYIGILSGAVLLTVLISPVLKLGGKSIPTLPDNGYIEYDIESEIRSEFRERVELDIEKRLWSEYGINSGAIAEVEVSDGKISGIGEIRLDCGYNEQVRARLLEIYGCERVVFGDG